MSPLMKTVMKVGGAVLAAVAAELIRENMHTIKSKISNVMNRCSTMEKKVQTTQ